MENGANIVSQLLPLLVLVAIFYILIIRPQQVQRKKHKEMIESLQKGDKIITSGGFIVEILKVESDFFSVELSNGANAKLSKEYVAKKYEPSLLDKAIEKTK